MKTEPLNIMLSYPVKWEKRQVLRDIVQNFYDDAGMQNFAEKFRWEYNPEEKLATISVDSEGFSYEWLMHMGASTKQEKSGEFAGFFGEGFKVASLCALRDFEWGITMRSRDWGLEVCTVETMLDDKPLQQLAYRLEENLSLSKKTILTISNLSPENAELLEDVILSFCYPENPLFGNLIYKGEYASVYERSKKKKPESMPISYDCGGDGIVYIGFQARGSFVLPLVICNHKFETEDRERPNIYLGTVLDVLVDLANAVDAKTCLYLLERLEKYWYNYPTKESDTKSWYPVIRKLIRKINYYDTQLTKEFVQKYPNLAVCEQPTNARMRSRKSQALSWREHNLPDSKLVQDSFELLGYDSIVTLCDRAGGFNQTRYPRYYEQKAFLILERATKEIFSDFFMYYPSFEVIENESSAFKGAAIIHKNKKPKSNRNGYKFRYEIIKIELKECLLTQGEFADAFATYCHELCHSFGGDASETFSRALTYVIGMSVANYEMLQQYNRLWIDLFEDVKKHPNYY
jgi:hypothetical protein